MVPHRQYDQANHGAASITKPPANATNRAGLRKPFRRNRSMLIAPTRKTQSVRASSAPPRSAPSPSALALEGDSLTRIQRSVERASISTARATSTPLSLMSMTYGLNVQKTRENIA